MVQYLIEASTLTSIADAIRNRDGTTDSIAVSDFASRINNIQTSTTPEITINENGLIAATSGNESVTKQLSSADDEDFIASNIKKGVTILGVTGTAANVVTEYLYNGASTGEGSSHTANFTLNRVSTSAIGEYEFIVTTSKPVSKVLGGSLYLRKRTYDDTYTFYLCIGFSTNDEGSPSTSGICYLIDSEADEISKYDYGLNGSVSSNGNTITIPCNNAKALNMYIDERGSLEWPIDDDGEEWLARGSVTYETT